MRNILGSATWTGAATVLAALLSGCASVPEYRYYTLDMQPSGTTHPTARLDTVKVEVGEALARAEIMIRTSPTQITYYALDRWASGLGQQLSEKLAAEFSSAPADAPAIWIEAALLAFEQVDSASGAEARVKVDVSAGWYNDGRRATDFHKTYERSAPASAASADAVVQALSKAVEAVAADISNEPSLRVENYRAASGN